MALPTLADISHQLDDAAQIMEIAGGSMREAEKVIRHQRDRINDLEEANAVLDGRVADLLAELQQMQAVCFRG